MNRDVYQASTISLPKEAFDEGARLRLTLWSSFVLSDPMTSFYYFHTEAEDMTRYAYLSRPITQTDYRYLFRSGRLPADTVPVIVYRVRIGQPMLGFLAHAEVAGIQLVKGWSQARTPSGYVRKIRLSHVLHFLKSGIWQ